LVTGSLVLASSCLVRVDLFFLSLTFFLFLLGVSWMPLSDCAISPGAGYHAVFLLVSGLLSSGLSFGALRHYKYRPPRTFPELLEVCSTSLDDSTLLQY